jgi:hypothetical protein
LIPLVNLTLSVNPDVAIPRCLKLVPASSHLVSLSDGLRRLGRGIYCGTPQLPAQHSLSFLHLILISPIISSASTTGFIARLTTFTTYRTSVALPNLALPLHDMEEHPLADLGEGDKQYVVSIISLCLLPFSGFRSSRRYGKRVNVDYGYPQHRFTACRHPTELDTRHGSTTPPPAPDRHNSSIKFSDDNHQVTCPTAVHDRRTPVIGAAGACDSLKIVACEYQLAAAAPPSRSRPGIGGSTHRAAAKALRSRSVVQFSAVHLCYRQRGHVRRRWRNWRDLGGLRKHYKERPTSSPLELAKRKSALLPVMKATRRYAPPDRSLFFRRS